MQSMPHNLLDSAKYFLSDKMACVMGLSKVLFTKLLSFCISTADGKVGKWANQVLLISLEKILI